MIPCTHRYSSASDEDQNSSFKLEAMLHKLLSTLLIVLFQRESQIQTQGQSGQSTLSPSEIAAMGMVAPSVVLASMTTLLALSKFVSVEQTREHPVERRTL